jgi:hypothetical protein
VLSTVCAWICRLLGMDLVVNSCATVRCDKTRGCYKMEMRVKAFPYGRTENETKSIFDYFDSCFRFHSSDTWRLKAIPYRANGNENRKA